MTHPGDLLSAYLDGELTAAELATVARHVAGCGTCVTELEGVVAARSAVRSLPHLEPPPGVADDGASVVDLSGRRARRFLRWAAAAAAAAVLIGGVAISGGEPAPALDFDTMTENHTARVIVDPGISTLRGVVIEP